MQSLKFILLLSLLNFAPALSFKISELQVEDLPNAVSSIPQQACNNKTNFDFLNLDYLSKNNYMERALEAYRREDDQVIYGNEFQVNSTTKYDIFDYPQFRFIYHDENQTASFGQNEVILIEGGKVQIVIDFKWGSIVTQDDQDIYRVGNATARSISKQTPFAIGIIRNPQTLSWTGMGLISWTNITFTDFDITYIDCKYRDPNCTVTQEDIFLVKYLLFKASPNVTKTINYKISNFLNKWYFSYLGGQICCSHSFTFPNVTYQYKGPTKSSYDDDLRITIPRTNVDIIIDKNGSKPGIYSKSIVDPSFGTGTCAPSVTSTPSDLSVFGGGQELLSMSVFSNLLLAGINSTQLDTTLNRTFWSTKNFRFYIDDLATMMPDLLKNFTGSTDVDGSCNAEPKNSKIMKGPNNSTLKVILNTKCNLNVSIQGRYNITRIKLVEFDLNLTSDVYLKFLDASFDVWLKSYTFAVNYNDNFGWKVTNKSLADQAIKDSLQRLYEGKLFGSGWNLFLKQRNPAVYVSENSVIFYDKYGRN